MNSVIRIRFNFLQRLRVLFGQRVYVVLDAAPVRPHECYVAPKLYLDRTRLESMSIGAKAS